MKLKILLLSAIFFSIKYSFGQNYFNFYYTNIPKKIFDKYSNSFFWAEGWLTSGNYDSPEGCKNCFDYVRNSKLTKEVLDSLISVYRKLRPKNIYGTTYVPNDFYFGIDKKSKAPYIIKTLYRIEGNKVTPLFQSKIFFYDRPDQQLLGISEIQIFSTETLKTFDSALVLSSYKQKLEKDKKENPPPIIRN